MFPWLQISLLKTLEFESQVQGVKTLFNIVQAEVLNLILGQGKMYLCIESQSVTLTFFTNQGSMYFD